MAEFTRLRDMGRKLRERQGVLERDMVQGLTEAAALVADVAKAEIGAYQSQHGPFNAWSPLKPATVKDRVAQGYTPDDPLLRSGELRDSISFRAAPLMFVVGSDSEIMRYQEMGTETIPPRPVLGTALYRSAETVVNGLGLIITASLAGRKRRFTRRS